MEEIWKQVPFDNRYAVSNKGNVKSFVYGKERLLSPVLHRYTGENVTRNVTHWMPIVPPRKEDKQ